MPLPVEQAHPQAFKRLVTATETDVPVFDAGEVPVGQLAPYLVLWTVTTRPDGTALNMLSDIAKTRAIWHCVAKNVVGVQALAGLLSRALLDVVPVIDGRTCWPILDGGANQQPQTDDHSLDPGAAKLVTLAVEYVLQSVPGPST